MSAVSKKGDDLHAYFSGSSFSSSVVERRPASCVLRPPWLGLAAGFANTAAAASCIILHIACLVSLSAWIILKSLKNWLGQLPSVCFSAQRDRKRSGRIRKVGKKRQVALAKN